MFLILFDNNKEIVQISIAHTATVDHNFLSSFIFFSVKFILTDVYNFLYKFLDKLVINFPTHHFHYPMYSLVEMGIFEMVPFASIVGALKWFEIFLLQNLPYKFAYFVLFHFLCFKELTHYTIAKDSQTNWHHLCFR